MESRLSPEYYKRKQLMASLEVPTISEVKVLTGLPLASVIFEQCHEVLKADLGLEPYLEGPQSKLWTSPSDLLIGKVALKPPLTLKHIQALTHQGILELGSQVEQKFLSHMRLEKEKALKEQYENTMALFEIQKAELIANIQREADEKYGNQLREMSIYYENKICLYLWECSEQIRELEEQLQIEIDSLNCLWQEKLQYEIEETVKKVTEEFLEKMRLQEQVLVEIYTKQMNILKNKKKCAVEFERTKGREALLQLKHKLQCENISNLMYLLCKERRKCKYEKTNAENYYLAEIRKLKRNVNKQSRIIKTLKRIKAKKTKQIQIREKCLIEILRQFKKFIYYALKAAPTQGEFLLNVEKLINFELEDYCLKKPEPKPQILEAEKLLIEETSASFHSQLEEFLKESQEGEEEEVKYSDVLPAFYFNDKMYVREDFRDMLSVGIEINQKHSLWNPDVEELLKVFEESIKEKQNAAAALLREQSKSSVHFSEAMGVEEESLESEESTEIQTFSPDKTPPGSPRRLSENLPSSVGHTRRISLEEREEREIRKYSLDESVLEDKLKRSLRSPKTSNTVRLSLLGDEIIPKRPQGNVAAQSRISLARDSLILQISNIEKKSVHDAKLTLKTSKIKDKLSVSIIESAPTPEESVSDSDVLQPEDDTPSPETRPNRIFDNRTSKLVLATDSIEIIKSQAAVNVEFENEPQKPERKISEPIVDVKVTIEGSDIKITPKSAKKLKPGKPARKSSKTQGSSSSNKNMRVRIVGHKSSKEHEKSAEEFAKDRLKSLVNIMKESPSILRLFTSGVK